MNGYRKLQKVYKMKLKVKSKIRKRPRAKPREKPEKSFWHEVDETFFNFGKYGKRK